MKTRPRRFKLFVTAGTLRYGRFGSGGGGNFGVPPVLRGWDTPPVPGMVIRGVEPWRYPTGNFAATATANWVGFSGPANLTQTGLTPGELTGLSVGGGSGNGSSATWRSTVDQSLSFVLDMRVWLLATGTGAGNPGDQISMFIGAPNFWGFLLQNDATNGLFCNISYPSGVGTATTANQSLTGSLNGDQFRFQVNVATKIATLSRNGTVVCTSGVATIPISSQVGPALGLNTQTSGGPATALQIGKLVLWQ